MKPLFSRLRPEPSSLSGPAASRFHRIPRALATVALPETAAGIAGGSDSRAAASRLHAAGLPPGRLPRRRSAVIAGGGSTATPSLQAARCPRMPRYAPWRKHDDFAGRYADPIAPAGPYGNQSLARVSQMTSDQQRKCDAARITAYPWAGQMQLTMTRAGGHEQSAFPPSPRLFYWPMEARAFQSAQSLGLPTGKPSVRLTRGFTSFCIVATRICFSRLALQLHSVF